MFGLGLLKTSHLPRTTQPAEIKMTNSEFHKVFLLPQYDHIPYVYVFYYDKIRICHYKLIHFSLRT